MSMTVIRQMLRRSRKIPELQRILFRNVASQTPRTKPSWKFNGRYYLLIFPATSVGLCYWQIQRKAWKENLIKMMDDRRIVPPVPLPENLEELQEMEFLPVKARGHFDYTTEIYLGPKSGIDEVQGRYSMEGDRTSGYHVVTPFKLEDRDLTILVNRGWYPARKFDKKETKKKGQVHGTIDLVGFVRLNQKLPSFTEYFMGSIVKPTLQFGSTIFMVRDIDVLSNYCHTDPVFLDSANPRPHPDAPQELEKRIDLRNTHAEYAAFWGCLAIATFWMWMRYHKQPLTKTSVKTMIDKKNLGPPPQQ